MKNLTNGLSQTPEGQLSPKLTVSYVVPVDLEGNVIAGSTGGSGTPGKQVTGVVRVEGEPIPEGTEVLLSTGIFGQVFVEPIMWNETEGMGETMRQPLTKTEFVEVFGVPTTPLWNGTSEDVTILSMLKAIHEQNEALKRIGNETNTLLVQVAEHTRHLVPPA